MSLLLRDGDYVADETGGAARAQGGEETLGEVLFRLTARRGSFPFLPRLGSQMHRLRRVKPSAWDSLARQYAAEALAELAQLAVTGAQVRQEGGRLLVTVELLLREAGTQVTVQLEE